MLARHAVLCCGVTTIALLAAPGIAAAGTATSRSECRPKGGGCTELLSYTAAPGEANDVTLRSDGTFSDAGAPVTAGSGCVQLSPNSARCGRTGPLHIISGTVDVGDGNDKVNAPSARVSGGAGNDALMGESANGGLGDDRIQARDVDYAERTVPVSVDLAAGTGGSRGERDVLVGVRNVRGGRGSDTITGNGLSNTLSGGRGDDRIRGLAGNDDVGPGAGADRVDCGRGKDYVGPHASSDEDIGSVDRRDLLAGNCERVELLAGANAVVTPRLGRSRFSLRVTHALACPCRGRLKVTTARGTVLASGRGRDRRRRVSVPLTPAGRRITRGDGELLVVIQWRDERENVRGGYRTLVRR